MVKLVATAALAGIIVCACTTMPSSDATRSGALSERIVATGQHTDWYGSLEIVDGKPHVQVVDGSISSSATPDGLADVYMIASTSTATATEACGAIAAVVNDPAYGPSLLIQHIWVDYGSSGVECFPPQKT
jgi:hypothetical protein